MQIEDLPRANVRAETNTPRDEHPPTLTPDEVCRVFDALSFATAHRGLVMNTLLTFLWRPVGVDGREVTRLLGRYTSESAKWHAVGEARPEVKRVGRRYGHGTEFAYVVVHENGGGEGFHSHLLTYIPPAVAPAFIAWSRSCLCRLAGVPWIPQSAFHAVMKPTHDEHQGILRQWAWFRYCVKQLDESWHVLDAEGNWRSARAVFKPWPQRQMKALPVRDAVRVSHNLGRTAQREAGFVSRYTNAEFEDMYTGWEVGAWRQRQDESRRNADLERVRREIIPTLSI